jgi:hypothetical protein
VVVLVGVAAGLLATTRGGGGAPASDARSTTTAAAGGGTKGSGSAGGKAAAGAGKIPSLEAGVLPWNLSSALSRPVVVPGGGSAVLVLGGLTASTTSTSRIFSLDTSTGNETVTGALAAGLHDAGGTVLAAKVDVFGGGSPNTVADVEQVAAPPGAGVSAPAAPGSLPAPATTTTTLRHKARPTTTTTERLKKGATTTTTTAPGFTLPASAPIAITGAVSVSTAASPVGGAVVGQLPQPRSDDSAVTIGSHAYVVGGYDGTNPDATVLSTSDGQHFAPVADLAVPVRYGAVAALGTVVYVFGGEAVSGPQAGQAVDDVQLIDPARHRATVVGHLPNPVAGASAFVLGGVVYLAGGVGNAAATAGAAGAVSTTPTGALWAWDAAHRKALAAGTLPVPVAYAGVAVTGGRAWLVGGESGGAAVSTVEMAFPNPAFGPAGSTGAGSPYYGYKLLVADRGNDRLLVMTPGDQIQWTYPSVYGAAPPGGFYFPDDAFFAKKGSEIISNQEGNETIVIIGYPTGKVLWQYGHPHTAGSAAGYLHEPDDAYLLANGEVTVADATNCRILFINQATQAVTAQIGTTGTCTHRPPSAVGTPNGDTPLADGNFLVSEIKGQWISEYTHGGQLVWTVHLPIHYPSDPQQLGSDLYLVSDYTPAAGGIDLFNREGQLLYRLQPASGITRMNQPSLTELLPSGVWMTNDDYRDRMVAYDPGTGALVWQYGTPDHAGTAPGQLSIPDGFDLLAPNGTTPLHPLTG